MNKLFILLFLTHLFLFSCTPKKQNNPITKLKKGLWLPVNANLIPFRYIDRPDTLQYNRPPALVLNNCPSKIISRRFFTYEHEIYQDKSGKWKFDYHHSFNDWDYSISSNLDTLTFLFSNFDKGAQSISYTYECANTSSGISTPNELENFLKNTVWVNEISDTSQRVIGFFTNTGIRKDQDSTECSYTENFSIPAIHYIGDENFEVKTRCSYNMMHISLNNHLFFITTDFYFPEASLEGIFAIKRIDKLDGVITLRAIDPSSPHFKQDIVWKKTKMKKINTYVDSMRTRYNHIEAEQEY